MPIPSKLFVLVKLTKTKLIFSEMLKVRQKAIVYRCYYRSVHYINNTIIYCRERTPDDGCLRHFRNNRLDDYIYVLGNL